jgi:hypothetical protein
MASLFGGQEVNFNDLPDDDKFDPVPAGTYVCRIVESDVKPNSTGSGMLLKLTIKIDEGEFAGRQFWENLNIQHKNPTAQQIGQSTLKKLMRACGIQGSMSDSEQLHNIPFTASVKIDHNEKYGDSNKLKSAAPYQNPTPTHQQPAQQQPAQNAPPASGAGGLPWENNG